jgi:hypothetical protein
MKRLVLALVIAATAVQPAEAQPRGHGPVPHRVGQCVTTTIRTVSQRLEDGVTHRVMRGSGSAVDFANGLYQVSYDQVGAVNRSRRGDPARVCLAALPTDCPAGDDRGKVYRTTNLRTRQSWSLPDSEHGCGGA